MGDTLFPLIPFIDVKVLLKTFRFKTTVIEQMKIKHEKVPLFGLPVEEINKHSQELIQTAVDPASDVNDIIFENS